MITGRGGITHQEEARMGYNTDEIVQWLAALDTLEADLAAAGVGVMPDPDDDTYRWFEFEGLLRTIGVDPAAKHGQDLLYLCGEFRRLARIRPVP
jgi:hypothetical protein